MTWVGRISIAFDGLSEKQILEKLTGGITPKQSVFHQRGGRWRVATPLPSFSEKML
jgi:hypothetical protein